MRWVDGYVDAWRAEDPRGVERLFTEDAHYRRSPYEKSEVGHDAIKAFWLADAGEIFVVGAAPVAVDGQAAVVRVNGATAIRCSRSTGISGCCSLPTTAGSATSRNGPTGRASHSPAEE